MSMTSTMLRCALVSALALTMGCTRSADAPPAEKSSPSDWRSAIEDWDEEDPIPDVPLINHEGGAFQLADLDAQHILIGFVFSPFSSVRSPPQLTLFIRTEMSIPPFV